MIGITLYVAKFPSRKDDYVVGLWEHFSHLIATTAGVNVAKTKVLSTEKNIIHCCHDVSIVQTIANVFILHLL